MHSFSRCARTLCFVARAGLLKGRWATTHWLSFHLLPYLGAIPVNERVVADAFAAGVTAGAWRGLAGTEGLLAPPPTAARLDRSRKPTSTGSDSYDNLSRSHHGIRSRTL
jgi:hypothetical protein